MAHSSRTPTFHQPTRHQTNTRPPDSTAKEDLTTTLEIISLASLLSSSLDLTATSALVRTQGVPIERHLQTIASGALGPAAFQGGRKTAAIGVLFHFFIAFTAAVIYTTVSRTMSALLDYPLFSGVVYGSAFIW